MLGGYTVRSQDITIDCQVDKRKHCNFDEQEEYKSAKEEDDDKFKNDEIDIDDH